MKLADIEAILGKAYDVTSIALPNKTLGTKATYYLERPNLSGPPLARWACFADRTVNPTLEFPCAAVQEETTGEWFMISICDYHARVVGDLPFRDFDEFLPPEYR